MATEVKHDVKYLSFEINITGMGGMSPKEAEDVVRSYLNDGFVIQHSSISNLTNKGFFVVHVLAK